MPTELGLSIPRSVRFTATGKFVAGIALALAGGSIFSVVALLAMNSRNLALAQQLDREGVQVQAQVIELEHAGENGERLALYQYKAGGLIHRGRETLRRKDARELPETLAVRYLASDPGRSWVLGYEPEQAPPLVVAILSLLLLTGAFLLSQHLRRQRWMLAEGRAVEARVISAQKAQGAHQKQTRVEYEFQTLSGATRRIKIYQEEGKPIPGSNATLLYDSEDPNRVALYPMSTVAVDRGL